MGWKPVDMIGKRFGRLVVIKRAGWFHRKNGGRLSQWLCQCDCGNQKILVGVDIRKSTKSCGCLVKKEKGEAAFQKLYTRFVRQARDRGYSWKLSKDEVRQITSQSCYYCGDEPQYVSGEYNSNFNGVYIYNGIDRVDNSKGYVLDNCVPCCKRCNQAKMNLTIEQFKLLIVSVYKNWASTD